MQLPFKPGSVNVWLLDDPDGWTIIDAGFDWDAARADWSAVLGQLPVSTGARLLMTHGHFDHVGLAGWLCEHTGATFHLAQSEFDYISYLRSDWDQEASSRYFRTAGCSVAMIDEFATWKGWALQALARVPETYIPIADHDIIRMGGRDWRVLSSGGHSRGQRAFYCERDGFLIAGDLVLPRIHASIGVCPDNLAANPLEDAIAGWRKLRELPSDTAVLPSHGLPFTGLHARLDQLAEHNHRRTERLAVACSQRAISAFEAMKLIFADAAPSSPRIAILEMQAQLNFMTASGGVASGLSPDGVRRFWRAS